MVSRKYIQIINDNRHNVKILTEASIRSYRSTEPQINVHILLFISAYKKLLAAEAMINSRSIYHEYCMF